MYFKLSDSEWVKFKNNIEYTMGKDGLSYVIL